METMENDGDYGVYGLKHTTDLIQKDINPDTNADTQVKSLNLFPRISLLSIKKNPFGSLPDSSSIRTKPQLWTQLQNPSPCWPDIVYCLLPRRSGSALSLLEV